MYSKYVCTYMRTVTDLKRSDILGNLNIVISELVGCGFFQEVT